MASGERKRWKEVAGTQSELQTEEKGEKDLDVKLGCRVSAAMVMDLLVRTGSAAHNLLDAMLHKNRDVMKMTV